jgi:hypothetical protein
MVTRGGGHRVHSERAAVDRADATAPASRDRFNFNVSIGVACRPLGAASFRAASATGAFIAVFYWQPFSGGMMIRREVGRMTSCFRELRVPK